MDHFKLLAILISLIFVIKANKDGPHTYCGSYLIKELKSVCKSRYYGRGRRSLYADNNLENIDGDYSNRNDEYNELAAILFDNNFISTYSLLTGNFHKRHLIVSDIVNECCKKPCSKATLSLYCLADPNNP